MADDVGCGGAAIGLGVVDLAGQRIDDVAGEMGAIGRGQRKAVLTLEVVMHDQFAVGVGKDQVDAGPLEIGAEQQMSIRNDDGVRRRVRRRRIGLDMGMPRQAVSG